MEADAVSNQRHADHQQKAEGEHHNRRVALDEVGKRSGGDKHDCDRKYYRDVHDREMLGHPNGGDDRVDREDQVEQQYLEDRAAEGDVDRMADDLVLVVLGIDGVVDLLRRLPDQEQSASDQDEVAEREAVAERREQRRRHANDPRDRRQKHEPHDKSGANAEATRLLPVLRRQLVR